MRGNLGIVAVVLGTLAGVTGCAAEYGHSTTVPQAQVSHDPSEIWVEISAAEKEACSEPEIEARVEAARASNVEESTSSALVLPQMLLQSGASWNVVVEQKRSWDELSPADRLFNLCFTEAEKD
ncbi:hypothetical protein GCM10027416_12460 [Okibacterium endophyticum]